MKKGDKVGNRREQENAAVVDNEESDYRMTLLTFMLQAMSWCHRQLENPLRSQPFEEQSQRLL